MMQHAGRAASRRAVASITSRNTAAAAAARLPSIAAVRVSSLPSRAAPFSTTRFNSYSAEGSTPPVASSSASKVEKATQSGSALSRTPLYDLHVQHGAKMVPFAGFEMPLTYKWGGQLSEHHQVRTRAGLFDVSHMVQHRFSGPGATAFLSHLLPTSLDSLLFKPDETNPYSGMDHVLGPYKSSLSLLLNKDGGIIDDLVVTRQGENEYYVVTNAGRRTEDLEHVKRELAKFDKGKVNHEIIDNGLLALQGPAAAEALQALLPKVDLSGLYFGQSITTELGGVQVHIARGGYTGEDGFEISIPAASSIEIANLLLGGGKSGTEATVQLVGLAARDSLRLEAGMCLYGHDLSEDVGPLEAGLTWVIGEDRRTGPIPFIGSEPTLTAMAAKSPKQKRVGLLIEAGPAAREGTPLYAPSAGSDSSSAEAVVGRITSGIPSPTLKQNIAMAYVQFGKHKLGTELEIRIRGKSRKAKVARMPFVKPNYYRGPAAGK